MKIKKSARRQVPVCPRPTVETTELRDRHAKGGEKLHTASHTVPSFLVAPATGPSAPLTTFWRVVFKTAHLTTCLPGFTTSEPSHGSTIKTKQCKVGVMTCMTLGPLCHTLGTLRLPLPPTSSSLAPQDLCTCCTL